VKRSVVDRLSETCGCSKKAVREELLPSLVAVQSDNSEDFAISIALGLSPEEHVAICGLTVSHRSTKELMERYAKELEKSNSDSIVPIAEDITEVETDIEDETSSNPGQMKLF
ncbi:MAG: hypothetical protein ACPGNS_03820, partial [Candidatus Poseidoniaceae archaeon]